ncbi:hypothetical protein K2X33_03115 [bacterium]|nr:hypothetical protein [bacterium]
MQHLWVLLLIAGTALPAYAGRFDYLLQAPACGAGVSAWNLAPTEADVFHLDLQTSHALHLDLGHIQRANYISDQTSNFLTHAGVQAQWHERGVITLSPKQQISSGVFAGLKSPELLRSVYGNLPGLLERENERATRTRTALALLGEISAQTAHLLRYAFVWRHHWMAIHKVAHHHTFRYWQEFGGTGLLTSDLISAAQQTQAHMAAEAPQYFRRHAGDTALSHSPFRENWQGQFAVAHLPSSIQFALEHLRSTFLPAYLESEPAVHRALVKLAGKTREYDQLF